MLLTYHILFQNTGSGFQRIHCGVNTLLHDLTGQNGGGIQMGECSCGCRVCQVIRRHIDSLYGSNTTLIRRSNTLLQFTDFGSQSGLISYCGRHTA